MQAALIANTLIWSNLANRLQFGFTHGSNNPLYAQNVFYNRLAEHGSK
jgi:hypothetical protein